LIIFFKIIIECQLQAQMLNSEQTNLVTKV
jgi:regulator of RNase E activity RraB